MSDPGLRASDWLRLTYGGLVELASPDPVHETAAAWLLACQTLPQPGYPRTPMLAASVVVPKDGGSPYHPAPSAPLADLEPATPQDTAARAEGQGRRINARGCLVAVHSAVEGAPSVALPWRPSDEAPGWWTRLGRRYFPAFERVEVSDWDDVIKAVEEPGPGTRGVIWVRREIGGHEASGNLLYANNHNGQVVLLDGLTSSLARLDTGPQLKGLVLLRALPGASAGTLPSWRRAAPDFASAAEKAQRWLDDSYGGQVVLDRPTGQDETRRGWVFSCNTRRFLDGGHWQDAMLDATVVVPKDSAAPFGLPNSDPWAWLARWDAGENPGTADLPAPPPPGEASWYGPTLAQLGQVLSVSEHTDWQTTLGALSALPVGARAVVWVHRTDGRGREAVGWLVNVVRLEAGVVLVDGATGEPASLDATGVSRLRVISYR
ncbi:YrhB domain-containing protein [Streptomyces sp. NPDC090108]|uniref:YrhB domain-containing protein n=1 Tax=Streptomyces sp. NPDC090108 TaxID=3365947 RepID=UPI0038100373